MIKSKKCKVVEITLRVNDNVKTQEFALAFLSIYNNCRENKGTFLNMEMTYDSSLFITVHPDDVKVVENWLHNFSDIWNMDSMNIEEVSRTIIDDWDDDFAEDIILRHVGECYSLEDFEKAN